MRRYFAKIVRRNTYIRNKEYKTRRMIGRLAIKAAKRTGRLPDHSIPIKPANPFTSIMIGRICLKIWAKYATKSRNKTIDKVNKLKSEEEYIQNDLCSDRNLLDNNVNNSLSSFDKKVPMTETKTILKTAF